MKTTKGFIATALIIIIGLAAVWVDFAYYTPVGGLSSLAPPVIGALMVLAAYWVTKQNWRSDKFKI